MKRSLHPWQDYQAFIFPLVSACFVVWYFYPKYAAQNCNEVCEQVGYFSIRVRVNGTGYKGGGCHRHRLMTCDGKPCENLKQDWNNLSDMLSGCEPGLVEDQFNNSGAEKQMLSDLQVTLELAKRELTPAMHVSDCQCDVEEKDRDFLYKMAVTLAFHFGLHVVVFFIAYDVSHSLIAWVPYFFLWMFYGISKEDVKAIVACRLIVSDRYVCLNGCPRHGIMRFLEATSTGWYKCDRPFSYKLDGQTDLLLNKTINAQYNIQVNNETSHVSIHEAKEVARRYRPLVENWRNVALGYNAFTCLGHVLVAVCVHVAFFKQ